MLCSTPGAYRSIGPILAQLMSNPKYAHGCPRDGSCPLANPGKETKILIRCDLSSLGAACGADSLEAALASCCS